MSKPSRANAERRTGEETLLGPSCADAGPPALVELLDLFDELALCKIHLIILLSLHGMLSESSSNSP